jgi:hypothetical protein
MMVTGTSFLHTLLCPTKAAESQTVAAFSPGLRDDSVFRARCSSGKLSVLLLG